MKTLFKLSRFLQTKRLRRQTIGLCLWRHFQLKVALRPEVTIKSPHFL